MLFSHFERFGQDGLDRIRERFGEKWIDVGRERRNVEITQSEWIGGQVNIVFVFAALFQEMIPNCVSLESDFLFIVLHISFPVCYQS